jgi:hypothetical protein
MCVFVCERDLRLMILQTVAAAMRILCSDILIELEKPLSSPSAALPEVRLHLLSPLSIIMSIHSINTLLPYIPRDSADLKFRKSAKQ